MYRSLVFGSAASLALSLAACSAKPSHASTDAGSSGGRDAPAAPAAAPAAAAPATGKVIEVKVISDEQGNRFEPSNIEAKRGDVLRVTLVSGAHNLNFSADKNPGVAGLPAPSPMLQLPGQTHDIPVTFGPGAYTFQCDPHAPLGMVGKLVVKS